MRRVSIVLIVLLVGSYAARAAGPLNLTGFHLEPMDGVNTFPDAGYVTESAHSTPCGCGGTTSDQIDESSAYHYFFDTEPFVDTPLVGGQCMDIRHLWLAWDTTHFYVGVQGPNELWERGDLFVAIDTDNATGAVTLDAPWAKRVDFCGWDPEFFIAVEAPVGTGGYAALTDAAGGQIKQFTGGVDAADSGWIACDQGGMYYEFAVAFADVGLPTPPVGGQVNFALYTTYEDDGFDTYDTGPGCGQAAVWEELGDYPYDADHCGGEVDCVTGLADLCGAAESDDGLLAGIATADRYPGSDNTPHDIDTIQEYYGITNFGAEYPIPTELRNWGDVKALYR
ncbi:hypothetical protein KKG45_08560 [bacterium]|nr:hypothetical protein [bacterium]MBU1073286.1 hypothetical protein [bacterium]MBU1676185.1 hypothetical protein [bacterium]